MSIINMDDLELEAPVTAEMEISITPESSYEDDTGGSETNPYTPNNNLGETNRTKIIDMSDLTLEAAPIAGGNTEIDPLVEDNQVAKAKRNNMSDISTYAKVVAPYMEEQRNEYSNEYPDADDAELQDYAKEQAKRKFKVDDEWMKKASDRTSEATPAEQDNMMGDFHQRFMSGNYESMDGILDSMAHQYDRDEVEKLVLNPTQTKTFNEYYNQAKGITEKGKGNITGAINIGLKLPQAIYGYTKGYLTGETDTFSKYQSKYSAELTGMYMANDIIGSMVNIPRLINDDINFGSGARKTTGDQQRILRDTTGGFTRAAAMGPYVMGNAGLTIKVANSIWGAKNVALMSRITKGNMTEAAGAAMFSAGEMFNQQEANDMNRNEVLMWSTAIGAMPAITTSLAALTKLGGKIGGMFVPGNQMKLAKKYVERMLSNEDLAKVQQHMEDMRRLGAFMDLSLDERFLVAASRVQPNLADELAGQVKHSIGARHEMVKTGKAIAQKTGKKKVTGKQAAELAQDMLDTTKKTVRATSKALTDNLLTQGIPARDITKPQGFDALIDQLTYLPANLEAQIKLLDEADAHVTVGGLRDMASRLTQVGVDVNDLRAKRAGEMIMDMATEASNTIMNPVDAAKLLKQADNAEVAAKVMEDLIRNNRFMKALLKGRKGAWDIDAVLGGKNIDIGRRSTELEEFLDGIPTQFRTKAERIVVDAYAQAFEDVSKAAKDYGIADFGPLANSIGVLRNATIKDPVAKAKIELLETISRMAQFDAELNRAMRGANRADAKAANELSEGIGFGVLWKIAKKTLNAITSRTFQGAAYETKLLQALDKSKSASILLNKGELTRAQAKSAYRGLFDVLYEDIAPTYGKDVADLDQAKRIIDNLMLDKADDLQIIPKPKTGVKHQGVDGEPFMLNSEVIRTAGGAVAGGAIGGVAGEEGSTTDRIIVGAGVGALAGYGTTKVTGKMSGAHLGPTAEDTATRVNRINRTVTSQADRKALNEQKKKVTAGYTPKAGIGVDVNSKMSTALQKIRKTMPNDIDAEVNIKSLRNQLKNHGVSQKEIDLMTERLKEVKADPRIKQMRAMGLANSQIRAALGVKDLDDVTKVSLRDVMMDTGANKIEIDDISDSKYSGITKGFDETGGDIRDYKVRGFSTERDLQIQDNHNVGDTQGNTQLGWSRGWTTEIGSTGKDAHVLGEFQSDIAQGTIKDMYPIDYSDFKKLAIVDGIDQTINKGLDTMIIPIERSGRLAGSEAITKMYSELNKGILPKLQQQLKKQGLDVSIKQVDTKVGVEEVRDSAMTFLNKFGADAGWEYPMKMNEIDQMDNVADIRKAVRDMVNQFNISAPIPKSVTQTTSPSHFEIKIDPNKYKKEPKTPREFEKQYKQKNENKFEDLTEYNLVKIERSNFSMDDQYKIDETYNNGSEFDDVDMYFDAEGAQYASKQILDKAGVKPKNKLYEYKINEGAMDEATVNGSLEDVPTTELGWVDPTYVQQTKDDLIDTIDYTLTNETGQVLRPDQKFVLEQAQTVREMHDIVADMDQSTVDELWPMFNDAYKATYGDAGAFVKPATDQIKTRWDMLGLVGALGLSSQYDKLKEDDAL